MKFLLITLFFIIPEEHVEFREVRIYGGTYIYSLDEKIYMFEDGVELYGKNFFIKGDVAVYDAVSKELYLGSNIRAVFNGEEIKGDYLYLNLQTGKGEIFNVNMNFKEGIYNLKAEVVKREGEKHYTLICSSFTPCRCPQGPPSWRIIGKRMEFDKDRFSIKKGFFLLKDVPVFYIPYLTVPIIRERKTGFLFPEFVYSSRDGYELFFPFFWAIDVDKDLAVEVRTFTARGVGGKGVFRYALPGRKYLHLEGEFFWEGMLEGEWRYLFNGWGRFPFTFANVSFEGAYPSDRRYFKDYARYVEKAYSSHIDSRFFVSSQKVHWYTALWGRYVENLKQEGGSLQVFPALAFSLYPSIKYRWMRLEMYGGFRNYIEEGSGVSVKELMFSPSFYFYPPFTFLESHFYSGVELLMKDSSFRWSPQGGVYLSLPFDFFGTLSIKPYLDAELGKEGHRMVYFGERSSNIVFSTGVKIYFIKDGKRLLRMKGWFEHSDIDSANYELLFSAVKWGSIKVEGGHSNKSDYLLSAVSLNDARGDRFSVSWFSFRDDSYRMQSLNLFFSLKLHTQLFISSHFAISISPFSLVQAIYRVYYKSACDCWGMRFSYIDREGTNNDRFSISVYLTGIGEFGTFSNML